MRTRSEDAGLLIDAKVALHTATSLPVPAICGIEGGTAKARPVELKVRDKNSLRRRFTQLDIPRFILLLDAVSFKLAHDPILLIGQTNCPSHHCWDRKAHLIPSILGLNETLLLSVPVSRISALGFATGSVSLMDRKLCMHLGRIEAVFLIFARIDYSAVIERSPQHTLPIFHVPLPRSFGSNVKDTSASRKPLTCHSVRG
jgi:hypothetical protein